MHNNHPTTIPLIIDGDDYLLDNKDRLFNAQSFGKTTTYDIRVQGADLRSCQLAVDSCALAFESWRDSNPQYRHEIFLKLAALLQSKGAEIQYIMEEEINCSPLWSLINLKDSIKNIQEAAALVTSPALRGTIPLVFTPNSQALVLKEPLGVILGIAPWNSPIVLCSRAVVAPIAAGNTAILKGSELSPRTHYFIAKLFQAAGFPRGVLNFILHREEDAPEIFKALIERKEVRKCNFTGSTAVGRVIASQAAMSLKPVLLELGGKNFVVVLEDADLDIAARLVIEGAFLNSGQICMSTDIVLIAEPIMEAFKKKIFAILETPPAEISVAPVISDKSCKRLKQLLDDAVSKCATLAEFHQITSKAKSIALIDVIPATIIYNLDPSMAFYSQEAFGPLLGLMAVTSIAEAAQIINACPFGLSASILTHKHFEALKLAKKLRVGAIHVNGSTVHDESILPHGGYGDSGWGRFGADWGMDEWLQTKTVILNE